MKAKLIAALLLTFVALPAAASPRSSFAKQLLIWVQGRVSPLPAQESQGHMSPPLPTPQPAGKLSPPLPPS